MRIAHLADAYQLRAEPHGPTMYARHLCMAISNCTYYESLVTSNPVKREVGVSCVGNGRGTARSGGRPRTRAALPRRACFPTSSTCRTGVGVSSPVKESTVACVTRGEMSSQTARRNYLN